MISDFHSHILPGIDDGSRSIEESIKMLKEEASQGISRVIATPHFYASQDSPENFLTKREAAVQRLTKAMSGFSELPEIKIGAEVHYFQGICNSSILDELTIDKKRCILIEMPQVIWSDYMYDELMDIYNSRDLIPIIAHVDRYISPFRTHKIPERLSELPVLVQANANFFLRRSTSHMALRMLSEGKIHLIGSDCHNMTSRPPNLKDAAEVIRDKGYIRCLRRILRIEEEILNI